jgi:hypothetical protein
VYKSEQLIGGMADKETQQGRMAIHFQNLYYAMKAEQVSLYLSLSLSLSLSLFLSSSLPHSLPPSSLFLSSSLSPFSQIRMIVCTSQAIFPPK